MCPRRPVLSWKWSSGVPSPRPSWLCCCSPVPHGRVGVHGTPMRTRTPHSIRTTMVTHRATRRITRRTGNLPSQAAPSGTRPIIWTCATRSMCAPRGRSCCRLPCSRQLVRRSPRVQPSLPRSRHPPRRRSSGPELPLVPTPVLDHLPPTERHGTPKLAVLLLAPHLFAMTSGRQIAASARFIPCGATRGQDT